MNTSDEGGIGGPSPFTEEEVAAVTAGPRGDPELEEVDPAEIEASLDDAVDAEAAFEKLRHQSKKLSAEHVRNVVESLLFISDKPLTLDQLYEASGIERERLLEGLNQLGGIRREGISGIVLYEVGDAWQLRTEPHSAEYVRRFLKVKPQRLTRAAVETLAIIAYRQPVTRPEVEEIRGVDSGAVVKALLDRKLIKIVGKKDEIGRPILYGTTREFLEFFALKNLSSLPTLREFQELTQEHQEIVEKEAPLPVAGTVAALSDANFKKKLEENDAASEAALAELEQAMTHAESQAKTVASALDGPKPEEPAQANAENTEGSA